MTNDQFDCCLTNRSGPASEAARLVLVKGLTVKEAMAETNLAEQTIRNALSRIRKRDTQIRNAYCVSATA